MLRQGSSARESGQAAVIFAILLPMLLAMGAFVIGIGNWFVHAKNLQSKADAGALAGGTAFEFPCGTGVNAIDTRIADTARLYAGPTSSTPTGENPQVGGVPGASITAVLNGPNWYDDDSNPGAASAQNLDICDNSVPMRLDVKLTEDNSFPLASLIPLFPDIKRKAVVELQEAAGVGGVLPIAVRAPEPQSMMAIFYREDDGAILGRKYFVKKDLSAAGLPGGLQGWSTENTAYTNDQEGWARVNLTTPDTGVVVGVSFRGACDTWVPVSSGGPGPPPGVTLETSGPCAEDGLGAVPGEPNYTSVDQLCNQGGSVQIVNCYYATGTFPSEQVQSGLHFIRSYSPASVTGNGPPEINDAYLTPSTCSGSGYGTGYFTTFPNVCTASFAANIDVGTCPRVNGTGPCVPAGTPNATESRTSDNVEARYTIVSGTGNNDNTCDFGVSCDLSDSGQGPSYGVNGTVVLDPPGRSRYAIGLRIRLKNTIAPGRSCDNTGFTAQCEWYFRGVGRVDTQPANAVFFNDPVQRAFRGNTVNSGAIRWLRLRADQNPCPAAPAVPVSETTSGNPWIYSGLEGSVRTGVSCFVVDLGLKGGVATDADNDAIVWNDGVGTSQLGYLDCTATGPQNIVWEIMNGCPPLYEPNLFNTNPYCPSAANLFNTPNPGPPFDNGDWPPLRCVKTRTTSQGQDLTKGFNGRFYFPNDPNPPSQPPNTCPSPNGNNFVFGRNYWKYTVGGPPYGYAEDDGSWVTHFDARDPRLVNIFLTTSEAFTGSGQNTYPVVGAIAIYITGYGRINGSGGVDVDDPCAGPLPSDLDVSGGNAGGRVVWGHLINRTVLSANATASGDPCNPGGSLQLCIPVLVE